MKKMFMLTLLSVFVTGVAHAGYYGPTDFDKTRIRYTLGKFTTESDAQNAAITSMEGLYDGVLPSVRMFQWADRDVCQNVNTKKSRRAISAWIKKRGKYANVRTYGFTISKVYSINGEVSYKARIDARIPCLDEDAN